MAIINIGNQPVEATVVSQPEQSASETGQNEGVESTQELDSNELDSDHADHDEEADDDGFDENETTENDQGNKKKGGFAKRLSKLTASKRAVEERNRELEAELKKHRELVYNQVSEKAPRAQPVKDKASEPDPEDFETYSEYTSAVADYKAEQMFEKKMAEREHQHVQRKVAETWNTRLTEAESKIPDLMSVLKRPLSVAPPCNEAFEYIRESQVGPELMYFFAKDQALLSSISKLSPSRQMVEVGKAEAKLLAKRDSNESKPATKTVTKASSPPPVLDGSTPGRTNPDDYNSWKKNRAALKTRR
jgi:hypothetical protein